MRWASAVAHATQSMGSLWRHLKMTAQAFNTLVLVCLFAFFTESYLIQIII